LEIRRVQQSIDLLFRSFCTFLLRSF
jgi:hypothetical protein